MSEHDLDDVFGVGAGRDAHHRVVAGDHYPAHQHPLAIADNPAQQDVKEGAGGYVLRPWSDSCRWV